MSGSTRLKLADASESRNLPDSDARSWSRADTVLICALTLAALLTRLWRLGTPATLVFDEYFTVTEARYYLHGLPYFEAHPPLPSLSIAMSIMLFGDRPWAWRLPVAILGSVLIGLTYLLGRRMFKSRLSGTLAGLFILGDGLFLVDSRIALWEIFYLTFAAFAYLMLFRFADDPDPHGQRRDLLGMGLALGLSLGSKLLIPCVAVLLVTGSLLFLERAGYGVGLEPQRRNERSLRRGVAMLLLVGATSGFVYLAVFLPNYWFGSWHGVADQLNYSLKVFEHEKNLIGFRQPYRSRWWSWPLMLRPIRYWESPNFFRTTQATVEAIRALGNPIIWWGVLAAVPATAIRAAIRRSFPHAFVALGYALFLGIWIPNPRFEFVHFYMPALYLGVLGLGDLLARCWSGGARAWEQGLVLASLAPAMLLGLGWIAGSALAITVGLDWAYTQRTGRDAGWLVCAVFVSGVLVSFVYFYPVWSGLPMTAAAFRSRMWLHGDGIANWI